MADCATDLDVKAAAGVTVLKEFPATAGDIESPNVMNLTPVGSKLFFVADSGSGTQVWVTDGTRAGTKLLKTVADVGIEGPAAVGSELFFPVAESHGSEVTNLLYKSNGTAAGTVPVALPAGSDGFNNTPDDLVSYGGELYFASGGRLMKSNGFKTSVIRDFAPANSKPIAPEFLENLTVAGGVLYFTFNSATGEPEDLYASNGTAKGTTIVHDFETASYSLSSFTAVGSQLFFGSDDPVQGPSLWTSNGTAAGTVLVKALGASTGALPAPGIEMATTAGTKLFFTTEPTGAGGESELWVSDGTAAGTTMLADIDPGNAGPYSMPSGQFAALGGTLYFANDDPAHGVELWQSNGTVSGTSLLADLNPGPAGSFPENMAVVNNTLYFAATSGAGSSALWSSNGTAAGTSVVASFSSQPQGTGLFENIPNAFAVIDNTMVFAADDGTGTELWKTDGTAAGTQMITNLVSASPSPGQPPSDFTTVGDKAFFVVTQGSTETLWVSDGTAAGTTEVTTLDGTLADPMAFDGKLAFIEYTLGGNSTSLWLSDGTVSGTTEVTMFPSLTILYGEAPTMAALNGKLFISAPAPPTSLSGGFFTMWESDGTAAGTMPVPGSPTTANMSNLAVYQGKVYFAGDSLSGTSRAQVWATDGTLAGTKLVANVGGTGYAFIDQFLVAGPNLYIFVTNNNLTGNLTESLYKTNGTTKGTALLHNFLNDSPNASAVLPNGDLAFDLTGDARSFWLSNGTVAGTHEVKDLVSSFGVNGAAAITAINGVFYLQGSNHKNGTELWQSNGTVAGTTLVQDISSDKEFSYPYALTELNGNLIVAAGDGDLGLELFAGPMPPPPAAVTDAKPARK